MSTEKRSVSVARFFWENLGVAALISVAAFGLRAALASDHTGVSPVWPAAGIALAAALLMGLRVAPGILLPLVAGSIAAGNPWHFSMLAPLGIVVSVYLGRWLCRWRGFDPALESTRDFLILAGLAEEFIRAGDGGGETVIKGRGLAILEESCLVWTKCVLDRGELFVGAGVVDGRGATFEGVDVKLASIRAEGGGFWGVDTRVEKIRLCGGLGGEGLFAGFEDQGRSGTGGLGFFANRNADKRTCG